MTLATIGHDFAYELECIIRLFFLGAKINIVKDCRDILEDIILTKIEKIDSDNVILSVNVNLGGFSGCEIRNIKNDSELCELTLSEILFEILAKMTRKRPVWGILTGIRPVRLCEKWSHQGLSEAGIRQRLVEEYLVSPQKADLCIDVGKAQTDILRLNTPKSFSLYISIPFCPTRCLYCSFVSQAVESAARLVPEYVKMLCKEICFTGKLAKKLGLKLLTVYIGGGTPTTLTSGQLRDILQAVNQSFDLSGLFEYTVEAGRPDTITEEKLRALKENGVDRVSVNPQTMNDEVLKSIGRAHTAKQVGEAMSLVKKLGFSKVNMDLIAGLPGEPLESFAETIEKAIGFTPPNITVHALTIKRSSNLRDSGDAFSNINTNTADMLDFASGRLKEAGYIPYYLYRQKATVDNLENIGYTTPQNACAYNILSMHDTHNILAVGAGAVSKLCFGSEHVKRVYNYKYPYEYMANFDEILKRKGAINETDY